MDMKLWRLFASFAALILPAGCVPQPAADQLFSPAQLSNLVAERTLWVPFYSNTPDWIHLFSAETPSGMLLYLARDGTGWLESRLVPWAPPQPSGMSMVLNWSVVDRSQVCLWASPRIGDMPSFTPAFHMCIQVLRSRVTADGLEAKITRGGKLRAGLLELYPFSAFSPQVIDQYLTQVRVLYGGQIPIWPLGD